MKTLILTILVATGCAQARTSAPAKLQAAEAPYRAPAPDPVCSYILTTQFLRAEGTVTTATPRAACFAPIPRGHGELSRIGLFLYGTAYTFNVKQGLWAADDVDNVGIEVLRVVIPAGSCAAWDGAVSYAEAGDNWTLKVHAACVGASADVLDLDLSGVF